MLYYDRECSTSEIPNQGKIRSVDVGTDERVNTIFVLVVS